MSKQPEALRLAAELEATHYYEELHEEAAAELRRLSVENDALLKALKILVLATKDFSVGHYNEEVHDIALSTARAVIKSVEDNHD